jgi:hypothetical protein
MSATKIPTQFQSRHVYHFTPAENLPTILAHGLLSIREQQRSGLPLRTVVWDAVLRHRAHVMVPATPQERSYEEYIPFYFCKLSPMLLAIMSSKILDEENIIHFEFPIQVLSGHASVFTDRAVLPNSNPNFYTRPRDLTKLNWDAIDSPAWRMPSESLRHARLSELLIPQRMPVTLATRVIVWDSAMAGQVLRIYQAAGIAPPRIETDPTCYFLESHTPRKPAISGPVQIYQVYQNTIQSLATEINQAEHPRFASLEEMRDCLQRDLGCLPETGELVGLETDNRAHFEDVGAHTRRVVAETKRSPEYAALSPHDQNLLEIAAFLHDIGKGPRARWAPFGGKQQLDPDHPIKALPMLRRILIEEIGQIEYADAVLLCKLVVYHDIIGGILFSGRRLEELIGIFEKPREFEMVMGLGRADSAAINPDWIHDEERSVLRQAVYPLLKPKEF